MIYINAKLLKQYYNPIIFYWGGQSLWQINQYFLCIELLFLSFDDLFFLDNFFLIFLVWFKIIIASLQFLSWPLIKQTLLYGQSPLSVEGFLDESKLLKFLIQTNNSNFLFIKMILRFIFYLLLILRIISLILYSNHYLFSFFLWKFILYLGSSILVNIINSYIIAYGNYIQWINYLIEHKIFILK
jgi:hypothetical protein